MVITQEGHPALSPGQAKVLDAIERIIARKRMPPTRSDLAKVLRCNRATVQQHLKALERKGYLRLTGEVRGIELRRRPEIAPFEDLLPLVGRVAAGPPLLATEDIDDYLRVDARLFRPRAHYLRRVSGDSMTDMGIQHGDVVGVHIRKTAEHGQVIVAKLFPASGPEITVKVFERRGSLVRLSARNARHKPILVDLRTEQFEIEGLYCGHFHRPT